MKFLLSKHAEHVIRMREIDFQWVMETINDPDFRTGDPQDDDLERFFRRITEREDRVLRVVANTKLEPWMIVSVFFDRRMEGKL
jgi:hypothetical protein